MPLISIREYARRRGVSHNAVRKAIQTGRLKSAVVESESGQKKITLIDSDMADKEWMPGTQEALKTQDTLAGHGSSPRPQMDDKASAVSATYAQSRSVREAYAARLAKLDFENRSGKLVDAEEVKKAWTTIASLTRTKILGIPSKCKQRIPDFTHDQYSTLEEIVREALEDLAEADD